MEPTNGPKILMNDVEQAMKDADEAVAKSEAVTAARHEDKRIVAVLEQRLKVLEEEIAEYKETLRLVSQALLRYLPR